MTEWIQGNWWWLLIGLGAVWFLLRRGHGTGCGAEGHSQGSHRRLTDGRPAEHAEHKEGSGRRHGGCC